MSNCSRRGERQIVFVCSSIDNFGNLNNKIIEAKNREDADILFTEQNGLKAKEILGPFYKKKIGVLDNPKSIRISNTTKKAIYNNWFVTAFLLLEPENYAYLIFNKRIDDKKVSSPKGTIVVPFSDLRFCDGE